MRRLTVACVIVFGVWIAAAGAAGAPKVTATVKTLSPTSRLVRIVNRDRVTYRDFVVQSINRPRIIAATKPCSVQRDGNFVGTTFNWRYQAKCRRALAPRQTFRIRLTTSRGSGRIDVFVVVKRALFRINK